MPTAQSRATAKWEKNNRDRIIAKTPKGTRERINATGESMNSFVIKAIEERLERIEKEKDSE